MSWIETSTGLVFDLLNPDPAQVRIMDIAHSLSNLCRYNGHCRTFYSVAEHSCYVHDAVKARAVDPKTIFAALLHDASEAYCSDVPTPMKPLLKGFKEIDDAIQAAIHKRFFIGKFDERIVKWADQFVLTREVIRMIPSAGASWSAIDWGFIAAYPKCDLKIELWTPQQAYSEFMERFGRLHW